MIVTSGHCPAEWAGFVDWCAAVEVAALPASPSSVLKFLAEHPAPAGTTARRMARIADAHRRHGHSSPTDDPAVRRAVRVAAGLPAEPAPRSTPIATERVDRLLALIPTTGWPTGLFGRRDRLLLLLRHRAGLTVPTLRTLTSDQLQLLPAHDDGPALTARPALLITPAGGDPVTLEATDDPRTCPPCCWRAWRAALHGVTTLGGRRTADHLRQSREPTATGSHVCFDPPPTAVFTAPRPVFPSLDRWGSPQIDGAALSRQSATTIGTAHLAGRAPVHRDLHPSPTDVDLRTGTPTVTAVPAHVTPAVSAEHTRNVLQAGLAARRNGVDQLQPVLAALDDIDQATADLDARIAELTRLLL